MINLAFICDDNYVMPTTVAITSILANKNKFDSYKIFIITSGLKKESIKIFRNFESSKVFINIIEVNDAEKYNSLKKDGFPVSTAALFKFELQNLLPSNINKVLYLDGDIIVQRDLAALYNTDIKKVYAGVVKDFRGLTLKGDFRKRLGISHTAYFNSGVLLLNLDLLRKENMAQKLLDYRINGTNYYMDQDAFNVVFAENVKYLSFYNNFQFTCWRFANSEQLASYYGLVTENDKYSYIGKAVILHFTADKPWTYYDYHCANIWLHYYLMSPYKGTSITRVSILDRSEVKKDKLRYFSDRYIDVKEIFNKNFNPKISVVMPVYNAESFICKAIDSLRRQSLVDFEVICVNDCSTDRSSEILHEYAKYYFRIRVIDSEINQGAGISRNIAIKESKGRYIVFLDADDELTPNALERFYIKGVETDSDLIVSKTFDGEKILTSSLRREYLPNKEWFSPKEISKHLFSFTHGGPSGKCIKRDFLNREKVYFKKMKRSEDIFFTSKVLVYCNKISVIDEALYRVNLNANPNSLEHTKSETPLIFWEATLQVRDMLIEQKLYDVYRQAFLNSNISRCMYNIRVLKNSNGSNVVKVKKLFSDSGINKELIDVLEINEHDDNYFYALEYKELKEFLNKTFDDFVYSAVDENIKLKKQLELIKLKGNEYTNDFKDVDVEQYKKIKAKNTKLESDLQNIKNSVSFKLGRILTYVPRKLRGGIRCYNEHGLKFTIRRMKDKIVGRAKR